MNINVQQTYWALGAAGFRENFRPLIQFVERLASGKGHKSYSSTNKSHILFQDTADEMYGCKGWVAHGFMEPLSMNTGLLGDAQWALCVTCGAWLALTLWESLLYEETDSSQHTASYIMELLKIYRGIVIFFTEYMFEDPTSGTFHTGPTTSPENSYLLREKNPNNNNNNNNSSRRLVVTAKSPQPPQGGVKPKPKPKF